MALNSICDHMFRSPTKEPEGCHIKGCVLYTWNLLISLTSDWKTSSTWRLCAAEVSINGQPNWNQSTIMEFLCREGNLTAEPRPLDVYARP